MKIWVNGTFDVLHIGHIRLLQHAASLGTLRVGIDTDERVRSKKGEDRPFNSLKDRMEFMGSIKGVDSVVWFDSDECLIDRIKGWNTDILVIGESCRDVFIYCDANRLCPDVPVPVLINPQVLEDNNEANVTFSPFVSILIGVITFVLFKILDERSVVNPGAN